MRLKDKIAIVTGAGSGIGRATAQRFAQEGAVVIAADRDIEKAETVAKELASVSPGSRAHQVDISQKSEVEAMVASVLEKDQHIDVLINNAGITRDGFAKKLSEQDWDAVLSVNLKGTFLCCQAVIPSMIEANRGHIVNTASVAIRGNMGQANYAAAKAGIVGLTRTLALELSRNSITVNCVAPGATNTPMLQSIPPEVLEKLKSRIPLKRLADPSELANLHLFLASDESAYITGQILYCDGDVTLGA